VTKTTIARFLVALCFTLVGIGCLLTAFANLYNIDAQPRSVIAGYAVLGLIALLVAAYLARRSRGQRSSSAERAP
jgi:divalent metal cation (Fe/Co/Zn/Cd) transporter